MKVDEMLNTCISHNCSVARPELADPDFDFVPRLRNVLFFVWNGPQVEYTAWWVLLLGLGQQWNAGFEMPYADFQEEKYMNPRCL